MSYRVGTQATFKADMLASITSYKRLSSLTTRNNTDLSIALLDGWATIADVLTFYQERIANEGFLRTAVERMSVLELAKSIGYKLRPGVSAATFLAFTMDTAKGSPTKTTISMGTKVQSIPAQDERPQTFETEGDIKARQEWNEMTVRIAEEQNLYDSLKKGRLILEGMATKLKVGDGLLFIVEGLPVAFRITEEIEVDPKFQQTYINFQAEEIIVKPESTNKIAPMSLGSDDVINSDTGFTYGDLQTIIMPQVLSSDGLAETELQSKAKLNGWSIDEIVEAVNLELNKAVAKSTPDDGVYLMRIKANVFGHNAPKYLSLPEELRKSPVLIVIGLVADTDSSPAYPYNWDTDDNKNKDNGANINTDSQGHSYGDGQLFLDNVYSGITENTWVVLSDSTLYSHYQVTSTIEKTLTEFALSARCTGITVERYLFTWEKAPANEYDMNNLRKFLKNKLGLAWVKLTDDNDDKATSFTKENDKIVATAEAPDNHSISIERVDNNRAKLTIDNSADTVEFTLKKNDEDDTTMVYEKYLRNFYLRKTTVYASPERLILASYRKQSPIEGQSIMLDRIVGNLEKGQPILVSGELQGEEGIVKKEVAVISNITHFKEGTILTFSTDTKLKYKYKRDTVKINANVARATHGETKEEALGGGDPLQTFQKFKLKQNPLTFLSFSSPTGTKSTLAITIDGIRWKEVGSFEGLSKNDKAFVTEIDNDSNSYVIFGDGLTGRLPPAGLENIKSNYRVGIGTQGMLQADQLSLLMKRPLGIRAVTNPLSTSGAADPEKLEDARKNAPRTVLTLDRIVSLEDYKSFAQGFAGVGKASSYSVRVEGVDLIVVAVALVNGDTISPSSDLYGFLVKSIEQHKDPTAKFVVRSFGKLLFDVRAKILVSSDRIFENVKNEVEVKLRKEFSFANREFGQGVTKSEVMSVIQRVEGVLAVDIDALHDHEAADTADDAKDLILAKSKLDPGTLIPKIMIPSLLLINDHGITIEEMIQNHE